MGSARGRRGAPSRFHVPRTGSEYYYWIKSSQGLGDIVARAYQNGPPCGRPNFMGRVRLAGGGSSPSFGNSTLNIINGLIKVRGTTSSSNRGAKSYPPEIVCQAGQAQQVRALRAATGSVGSSDVASAALPLRRGHGTRTVSFPFLPFPSRALERWSQGHELVCSPWTV